jgi:phosphoserine phosphatase RsbU/P
MTPAQVASLRPDIVEICAGTAFLVVGLTTFVVALMRRQHGVRVFLWLGIWSAGYGVQHLLGTAAFVGVLPHWMQVAVPYATTTTSYLMVVFGGLAWLDLVRGAMRRIVLAVIVAAIITAVLGVGWFVFTGIENKFLWLNNLEAACVLATLVAIVSSKRLFHRYLALPTRGFLALGTFVFATEALFANISRPLGWRTSILFDHLGFAVLLIGFGHSALSMVLSNEHRLLSIERELEIAREIQESILPTQVPDVHGLRIAASYQPMTAVAGDFYEFLPVDCDHAGFLVADVCGHGVPAALISSMLKVAVQSVSHYASDPSELLCELNRILSAPLRGQLVSAAYLWVDMKQRRAIYSAAGHPPLLRWNHELHSIESNGLLFGVMPNAQYPSREIPLETGDRLLLYTDGITEPENAAGASFGDAQLKDVLAANVSCAAAEVSRGIMNGIRHWQVDPEQQQDDMTLLVIDVV